MPMVCSGVRLPEMEVPVATYQAGPGIRLSGYTEQFGSVRLKELYPTHEDYVAIVTNAAKSAEDAGVILPYMVEEYVKMAESAPIPEPAKPNLTPVERASNATNR